MNSNLSPELLKYLSETIKGDSLTFHTNGKSMAYITNGMPITFENDFITAEKTPMQKIEDSVKKAETREKVKKTVTKQAKEDTKEKTSQIAKDEKRKRNAMAQSQRVRILKLKLKK